MKKVLTGLILALLLPMVVAQAGGSSFEVTQKEDSSIDVYSNGSFSTILEFDIDSYPQVHSDLGIKKLDVECYGVEGIEEAKLLKGNTVIAHKTSIENNNGVQPLVFLMVDDVVPYGETSSYKVQVKMANNAPNQRFACNIFDLRLYDKGSNGTFEIFDDLIYDHSYMITDFSVKNVVRGHSATVGYPSYSGLVRDASPYHAAPNRKNNYLAGATVAAQEGLKIDKVFASCSDARSLEKVFLSVDNVDVNPRHSYTDAIVYETTDEGEMYVFLDLNMDLDKDKFLTMLGDTNNEPDRGAGSQGCELLDYELVSTSSTSNETIDSNSDSNTDGSSATLPPAGYEDDVLTTFDLNPFPDTSLDDLEGRAAAELYRRAVLGGYPDGEFKGDREVNRAEASKFLLLARFGSVDLETENNGKFTDVLDGQWYVPYVVTMAEKGFIVGYYNGTFGPNNTINTAEFLKILTLVFDLETGLDHNFTDVADEQWYTKFAGTATKYNLFPKRGTVLNPAETITRDEIAVAIYQFLKNR